MKKILTTLLIAGLLLVTWAVRTQRAEAVCGIATELGRASYSVNISQAGTYKVWVRIKPADATNNAAYLLVDNTGCFKIGDNSALPGGSWNWVNYSQSGTTQTPITLNLTAGTHSLIVIGYEPGVEVDRTILLSNSDTCTPSNQRSGTSDPGDNCVTASTPPNPNNPGGSTSTTSNLVVATAKDGKPIVAAAANTKVSGDVVLDPSIVNNPLVQKVEYYVNGKLIYTSNQMPFHLDTSVLADGTYQITERAYFTDGHTEDKTSTLTISNHPGSTSASSKKSQWLIVVGVIVLVIAVAAALAYFNPTIRGWLLAKWSRITGRAARF